MVGTHRKYNLQPAMGKASSCEGYDLTLVQTNTHAKAFCLAQQLSSTSEKTTKCTKFPSYTTTSTSETHPPNRAKTSSDPCYKYQLLHYLPEVPKEAQELYSQNPSGRPLTNEMTSCLIALIRREKEVRMLGDAFDECTQWNVLWKFLTRMVKSECPSLRLLFTSRPEREIEDTVNSLGIPSLDLRTVMDGDIKQLLMETLENSA
jgi:hypothetical protein